MNVVHDTARFLPHCAMHRKGGQDGARAQVSRSSMQYESAALQFRPQKDVQYERENAFID
jgi:hypothetical protein